MAINPTAANAAAAVAATVAAPAAAPVPNYKVAFKESFGADFKDMHFFAATSTADAVTQGVAYIRSHRGASQGGEYKIVNMTTGASL